MNAWHKNELLAFDTETTSANPDTARIVTATIVHITPEGANLTEWLINPGVPIGAGATAVHGISNERAQAEGQDAETAIFEITAQLGLWLGRGKPVIAFNAAFDFTILDRECFRQRIDSLGRRMGDVAPIIDPHVIDKHVDPYRRGKRTLTAVCAHYNVRLDDAHNASADALGAARAAFALAERYPDVVQVPVLDLHQQQRNWRRDQAASLQTYFRKKDPNATVNGDWPVQQLPQGWTVAQLDPVEQDGAA